MEVNSLIEAGIHIVIIGALFSISWGLLLTLQLFWKKEKEGILDREIIFKYLKKLIFASLVILTSCILFIFTTIKIFGISI